MQGSFDIVWFFWAAVSNYKLQSGPVSSFTVPLAMWYHCESASVLITY